VFDLERIGMWRCGEPPAPRQYKASLEASLVESHLSVEYNTLSNIYICIHDMPYLMEEVSLGLVVISHPIHPSIPPSETRTNINAQ
jgi:hypothetical protein